MHPAHHAYFRSNTAHRPIHTENAIYASGSSGNLPRAWTNRIWLQGSRRFITSNISTATTLAINTFASRSMRPSRSGRLYV